MKVGLLTDIHVGKYSNSEMIAGWIEELLVESLDIFTEQGIEYVYILGDIFDNVESISGLLVSRFIAILKRYDLRYGIIVGNHDMPFKGTRDHDFVTAIFEHNPQVDVFNSVAKGKHENIVCSPYIVNEHDEKRIRDFADEKHILLGHFAVNGFKYSERAPEEKNGQVPSLFNGYKLVLSGHFHMKQQNGNIVYLGAGIPLKRDEVCVDHGVHILDTETGDLEFIDMDHINMFREVTYTGQEYSSANLEGFRGKIVTVRINSEYDPDALKAFKVKLDEIAFRARIIAPKIVNDSEEIEAVDLGNTGAVMESWTKRNCPEELEQDKLLNMLLSIAEEAGGSALR